MNIKILFKAVFTVLIISCFALYYTKSLKVSAQPDILSLTKEDIVFCEKVKSKSESSIEKLKNLNTRAQQIRSDNQGYQNLIRDINFRIQILSDFRDTDCESIPAVQIYILKNLIR